MLPFTRPRINDADRKVLRRWALASFSLHAILAAVLVVSAVVASQANAPAPIEPQMSPFKETGAPVVTVASGSVGYRVV